MKESQLGGFPRRKKKGSAWDIYKKVGALIYRVWAQLTGAGQKLESSDVSIEDRNNVD